MQSQLVLTIIGRDRPGLVGLLSGLITDHGGNWLESRMGHLGGKFAGILMIRISSEQMEPLLRDLNGLADQGLTVVAHPDESEPVSAPGQMTRLEITGQDRPGIVRQITRALADSQVNVEELDTECVSAPMSGETLFKASIRVRIPEGCDLKGLYAGLEKIAADLMVDIGIQDSAEAGRSTS